MQKEATSPKSVHVGQFFLAAHGEGNNDGEENGAGYMDAVEGMAPVDGDEPMKTIAVGHPFQQFAGSHKRGIHCHGQGEAGQGRHGNAERNPVEQGGVMGDEVAFVEL